MRFFPRWLRITLGAVVGLLLLATGIIYAASESKLNKKYVVTPATIPVPTDSASVARGEHLARAVTDCMLCHGDDLGGKVYADMGPMGLMAGPNLTRGRGGVGGSRSDADWVRAIRHGVRQDSTSLILMPSEVFAYLSVQDLGAIIAYLKQLPAVDREPPLSHFRPLGRALLAAGKLNILVAPKTPDVPLLAEVPRESTKEYGQYLANISGCHGCHGFGLSGGKVAGPPGLPPASNLTPTGMSSWTEADFARLMRQGKRPDGTVINEFMPWRVFANMTDDEVHAIWLYLQSVPPKPFGNK